MLKTVLASTSDPVQAQTLFNDFIKFCENNNQNSGIYLQGDHPQGHPDQIRQDAMWFNHSIAANNGNHQEGSIDEDNLSQISGHLFIN